MNNNNSPVLFNKKFIPFFLVIGVSMIFLNILILVRNSLKSEITIDVINATPFFWLIGFFFIFLQRDKIIIYKNGVRPPKKRFTIFLSKSEIEPEIILFDDLIKVRVSNSIFIEDKYGLEYELLQVHEANQKTKQQILKIIKENIKNHEK